MTINYTTLLGLAKPVQGTESNTWGDVVNNQITSLVEDAVANAATLDVTAGNVTLTTTDGASNQARMAILVATGTPGTTRNIVAPSQSKSYVVVNQSDSSVVIKGSATTGAPVRAGQAATVVWNGSDFEIVATGDVDGPASSTDEALARFDGTTGKLIQNSVITATDAGILSGVTQLNVDNLRLDGNAITSTDSNGNIDLTPNGTGEVNITKVDIDSGAIDGTVIGANSAAAGTFTTLSATTLGAALNANSQAITNVNIDSGAIDGTPIGGSAASTGAFTTITATGDVTFSGSGQTKLQAGGTAQRSGSPAAGMLRFNTDSSEFEGYNGTAWSSVGGSAISNDTSTSTDLYPSFLAATSGTAANIYTSNAKLLYKPSTGEFKADVPVASNGIFVNNTTIDASYTIASGSNGFSVGPVSVGSGTTITVSSGQRWVVI